MRGMHLQDKPLPLAQLVLDALGCLDRGVVVAVPN
jgi:hypothetical protein